MQIKIHDIQNTRVAEVISDTIVIGTIEDGADLLGNLYYQDFGCVILHEENITPHFFDLKTKMAGEILQKFSNYRVRLVIVGNFDTYNSNSLRDFIFESNNGRMVNFTATVDEALQRLGK